MEAELDTYDKIYELLLNVGEVELAYDVLKAKEKKNKIICNNLKEGYDTEWIGDISPG